MRSLAHISDMHFGDIDRALVLSLAEEIDDFGPDLIVVTGDVTEDAKSSQFESARGFLDSLPFPRLVIPGNHDIAPLYRPLSRFTDPYGRYRRYFPYDLNSVFSDDEILVLGLNTVHPLHHSAGIVSSDQLDWIESLVNHHPDRFHVLAAHHQLVHVEGEMMRESKALGSLLPALGIDLLLTGHLRESLREELPHHDPGPDPLLVAQASTATTREHGYVAYNRVRIAGGVVEIDLRAFDGDEFRTEHCASYRRGRESWETVGELRLRTPGSPRSSAQL